MKLIDLAMPLYEGMPNGHAHMSFTEHPLWPEAIKIETVRGYDKGSEFHVFTIFCEPGTRVILPSYKPEYKNEPSRMENIDLKRLILREAVVLDVPKGEGEYIYPEEIEAAFAKAPVQRGDCLIVRTGWGDNERYLKMGQDYREKSPHYTKAGVEKLLDILESNGSDMWLYDVSEMGSLIRPDGTKGAFEGFNIRAGLIAIGGAVNCGAITKPRVKLIILPMKVKSVHMAGAQVVAVED